MSNMALVVEEILVISAEIAKLAQDEASLRERMAQNGVRREDLKSQIVALVLAGHSEVDSAPPAPPKEPRTRKKRPFAGTGFIRTLLDFLKAHPNQEVTPETIASAVGEPSKAGLACTCLKRLWDAKVIERPRTGHYVLRGPLSYYLQPKQPKEPAMT